MWDTWIDSLEAHIDTWKDGQTIQSLRAGFLEEEDNVTALAYESRGTRDLAA
jgi:hypothetical protein